MNGSDVMRRLHEHRMWANQQLLAAARDLSDEALHHPLAIGQGSVWKSLAHMYAAEFVWLAAIDGNEQAAAPGDRPDGLPGNQRGETPIASLDELATHWQKTDEGWQRMLAGLSDDQLDREVWRVGALSGKRAVTRLSDVLLHVCTHAHYTVAQVVNMLRQLGVGSLPDPMLITLARQETASRTP